MKEPKIGDMVYYKAETGDHTTNGMWSKDTRMYISKGVESYYNNHIIAGNDYKRGYGQDNFNVIVVEDVSLVSKSKYMPYTKEYLDSLKTLPVLMNKYPSTATIGRYSNELMYICNQYIEVLASYEDVLKEYQTLDGEPAGILVK